MLETCLETGHANQFYQQLASILRFGLETGNISLFSSAIVLVLWVTKLTLQCRVENISSQPRFDQAEPLSHDGCT